MIYRYKGDSPNTEKAAFVAESADVAGEVYLEEDASIWCNVSIRGDLEPVYIGKNSNIQDNAVVHVAHEIPARIGNGVTVGHGVILHACTIGDHSLIGMGAIVLDGSSIGEESIVGAGALVTQNKEFPPRSLIIGSPAKLVRSLSDDEVASIRENADEYVELAKEYARAGGDSREGAGRSE
jgi:carbonic anhydrase/acetyltransferase-like protein (isoleucine patch superfamily)